MLRVENLTFKYDERVRPLESLSFEVPAREHTLLLGPSGSGKTTLIYLIAGLLTPSAGKVVLDGEDIAAMAQGRRDAFRRRKIGLVFQTLRLVSALSVEANLSLAQQLAGLKPDRAETIRILERIGLAHRARAKPHQLSVGEAQRAALARAIVTKPTLLIADEPTSALDDSNAANAAALLMEMADANGATLLIATHDHRLKSTISRTVKLGQAA